jgi:hypothetical protein
MTDHLDRAAERIDALVEVGGRASANARLNDLTQIVYDLQRHLRASQPATETTREVPAEAPCLECGITIKAPDRYSAPLLDPQAFYHKHCAHVAYLRKKAPKPAPQPVEAVSDEELDRAYGEAGRSIRAAYAGAMPWRSQKWLALTLCRSWR